MTLVLNGVAVPWVVDQPDRADPPPARMTRTTCRSSTRAAAAGATGSPAAGTSARSPPGPPAPPSACWPSPPTSTPARWRTSPAASTSRSPARRSSPPPSTSSRWPSARRTPNDRSPDPLGRSTARSPTTPACSTYSGLPYTEDPAELARRRRRDRRRADGRAHLGLARHPLRPAGDPGGACAPGPHLEAGVDALREVLRVIDFGDAPILPADPVRSHQAIQDTVAQVLAAGAIPIILGGDHSIAEPDMRAVRGGPRAGRPDPLRHPHRHRQARSSARRSRTARACTGSSSRA